MTVTIDPVTITTLGILILAAIGGFIWFGKLSGRVDRLETDVSDLKDGQKEILDLIHQQGTEFREQLNQQRTEFREQLNQQGKELRELLHQEVTEFRELLNQQGTELREQFHQEVTELRDQHQQHEKEVLELLHQHIGYHQGLAESASPSPSSPL